MRARILCLIGLAVQLACNSSDNIPNPLACGPNGSCPAGYVCDSKSNLCQLSGSVDAGRPDGSVDAVLADAPKADAKPPADAGGPDAAPPDAPRPAALSISPPDQDFASATLGSIGPPLTFTVKNEGDVPTVVLATALSDSESYTIVGGTCVGSTLGGGAQCTLLVTFGPSGDPGAKAATLTVSAGQARPATAELTGTALTPGAITLAPTSQDFGLQAIGSRSAEVPFTVRNTGQAPTGTLTATLSDTTNYSVSSNDCVAPLPGGGTCTIGIQFTPTKIGVIQGVSLSVEATPGGSATASLVGTGSGRITLTNAGGGRVVSTPPGIDCGTACRATFTTTPIGLTATPDPRHTFAGWAGACTGTGPCSVTLDAAETAVTALFDEIPAALKVTPDSQTFGEVVLGTASAPIDFTVSNTGGADTGKITATIDDETNYIVEGGTCIGATLASGASCTVIVEFVPPLDAGDKPATLTVKASPGGSATSALTATALTAGALALSSQSMDFGPVPLGTTSAPASFTVRNTGESPTGNLTAAVSDPTRFAISSTSCHLPLDAGAACTVEVVFTPSAVGLAQGVSLRVSSNPGGNVAASLQGTGTAQVNVTNAGGGTVASTPPGITCGDACSATFTGSPVLLTATPDALHTFGGWSPPCSGTDPCSLPLTAAVNAVTARFDLKPAALAVAPASQSFGSVVIGGDSDPIAFTVSNVGGATTGSLGATLSDTASYSVTGGTCPGATLAAGASCTVNVRFNPTGLPGPKPATLTVSGSTGESAASSLSGTEITLGALALAPDTKNFGSVVLGSSSAEATFTVSNTGESPTGTVTTTLSDSTNFTITSNTCGAKLDAGATCAIAVAFKPASVGAKTGVSLTVSGTPGGSAGATLQGTGTAQVTVTNAGGGTVTSTPPAITCGTGAGCTATFTTSPVLLTARPDGLHTFAGWSPPCTGTGPCNLPLTAAVNPVTAQFDLKPAAVAVAPAAQNFGSLVVGGTSDPIAFNVSNTGGATTGSLGATVSDTTNYTVTGGTCQGATLAAGATCTVNVRFNPAGPAGSKTATLTVTSSPGGSATSALSGNALSQAALGLAPGAKDFGSVPILTTSPDTTFTVTNNGQSPSGALTTTLSDTTSFTITGNDCAAALAAGASCHVSVAFKPGSVGARSGVTLTVSATPGGSTTSTLQGTGTAQIQLTNAGGGTVTSQPVGMSCSGNCAVAFSVPSVVLTATPDASHVFGSWTGACTTINGDQCTVTLDAASKAVTAVFQVPPCATTTVTNLTSAIVGPRELAIGADGNLWTTGFDMTGHCGGTPMLFDVWLVRPDGNACPALTGGEEARFFSPIEINSNGLFVDPNNHFLYSTAFESVSDGFGLPEVMSLVQTYNVTGVAFGSPTSSPPSAWFAPGPGTGLMTGGHRSFRDGPPPSFNPNLGIMGIGMYVFADNNAANFQAATGMAMDTQGNLYVADGAPNNAIRKIDPQENTTTIAGGPTKTDFSNPLAVAVDASGNLYVADTGGNRIRKIDTSHNVTTLAGNGTPGFKDGSGAIAMFSGPRSLAVDAAGNVYVADLGNHRVRKVAPDGTTSTLAGGATGSQGGSGCTAQFSGPDRIVVSGDGGNLYVTDNTNNLVRQVHLP